MNARVLSTSLLRGGHRERLLAWNMCNVALFLTLLLKHGGTVVGASDGNGRQRGGESDVAIDK